MKINSINNIKRTKVVSFNGVFTTNIKDIDRRHQSAVTTDYVDSFQQNADNITDRYERDRAKAGNKLFGKKRALRKIDDEYRGRMDAWKQDQEIFQKAKEAHLKDIEQLLESAKKRNATLDELTRLKSDFEVTQKTVELVKKQQAANINSGFNRIGGYEAEKATLQKVLINKIIEERSGLPIKLPNAVLFFGPTGTGKTSFAIALSQEINEGEQPVMIDTSNAPDEIMEEIEVETRRSRKRYKQTGERTIILLDEVEAIAQKDSEVLDELKSKLTKAFDDDKCIYVMTTNNPSMISPDILTPDRTGYIVNIDPPDFENALAVVKFYFSAFNQDLDYEKIARSITNRSNGKISNSGIEELYNICCSAQINTTDGIIDLISRTESNITENEVASYENDKKLFLEREINE